MVAQLPVLSPISLCMYMTNAKQEVEIISSSNKNVLWIYETIVYWSSTKKNDDDVDEYKKKEDRQSD